MEGNENNNNPNQNNAQNTTGQENAKPTTTSIDYAKIQEMIDGRNAKTEDSILKSYFEKQGLSQEEMESAISTFKTQKENKAKEQNKELLDTQSSLQKMKLKNQMYKIREKAYSLADELNVENKTMPYILKMAEGELMSCIDKDGKVLEDTLKTALEKVLKDVPGLKKQVQGNVGIQVGADTSNNTNSGKSTFDFNFTGVRPRKN